MGDVGSLALGGAIGTVAIIIRQELLLPFIGGIFILEAVSVILQVGSYKLRNKSVSSGWRRYIITSSNWAGANRRSSSVLDWRSGVCIVCTHHAETPLTARAHCHSRCTIKNCALPRWIM